MILEIFGAFLSFVKIQKEGLNGNHFRGDLGLQEQTYKPMGKTHF